MPPSSPPLTRRPNRRSLISDQLSELNSFGIAPAASAIYIEVALPQHGRLELLDQAKDLARTILPEASVTAHSEVRSWRGEA